MSDVANARSSQAQDLADLQAQYLKKRKEMISEEEQDLHEVKKAYGEKIKEASTEGEAAINHIRKATSEREAATKDDGRQKLETTREQSEKDYAAYKRTAALMQRAIDHKAQDAQESADLKIKAAAEHEERVRANLSNDTSKYAAEQGHTLENLEQTQREKLAEVEKGFQQKRIHAKEVGDSEIDKLNKKFQVQYGQQEKTLSESLQKERENAAVNLTRQDAMQRERLEQEKVRGVERYGKVKESNTENEKRIVAQGEVQDQELQAKTEQQLAYEKKHGETKVVKVHNEFETQVATTKKVGEHRVTEQKTITEDRLKRQQAQFDHDFEQNRKVADAKNIDLQRNYQNQMDHNSKAYDLELKQQKEHFDSTVEHNEKAHQDTLRIQEGAYDKELMQKRNKIVGEIAHYDQISQDPFYHIENRKSDFYETPTSYVLRTYIPKFENDNIKVKVHPDRVSVVGQRLFQDKATDDEKKMETSNFQTFKEDFPFTKNVVPEAIQRERDGNFVTVTIPKLSAVERKV